MDILSMNEIKKKCALDTTYSRGKTIYNHGEVYDTKMVKVSERSLLFSALVEGSYENEYEVNFEVEKQKESLLIKDYECSCPAFRSYDGICKHLVALSFEINDTFAYEEALDYVNNQKIGDEYVPEEELNDKIDLIKQYLGKTVEKPAGRDFIAQNSSGKTYASVKHKQENSSPTLMDAISEVARLERDSFYNEIANGDIQLELTLNIDAGKEEVELRIGRNQMYIVKNISELVNHIREERFVKYGKNLEFVHNKNAFSKESLPILEIIENNVQPAPVSGYYHYRNESSADKRYMSLDERRLDEVMNLFLNKELYVKSPFDLNRVLIPVKDETPRLPLFIRGEENGKRAVLEFPEILLLEGYQTFYIWWKHCLYKCSDEFYNDMKPVMKIMAVNRVRAERQHSYFAYAYLKDRPVYQLFEKDYAAFCSTLLPVLERHMDVESDEIDFSSYRIENGKYELYFDLNKKQDVLCQAKAIYGEETVLLGDEGASDEVYRDKRQEYRITALLEQYFTQKLQNGTFVLPKQEDDRMVALLERGMRSFHQYADVYVSDAFKQIKVTTQTKIATGLSIKGNLLNVTWNVEGMSSDELYHILSSYRQRKKYFRLKTGEIINLNTSGIDVFAQMQDNLRLTKEQLKTGEINVPLYRSMYLDSLMEENRHRIEIHKDMMYRNFMKRFEHIDEAAFEVPEEITAQMRPYQVQGFRWASVLGELGFGGILADDMGLGKTLQMITYLCNNKGKTHLVVCPASLCYNWEAEFAKFYPTAKVCLIIGTAEERKKLLETYEQYDVLISSYDLLKRDVDVYQDKKFGCQVIDEAQYIKNAATQAAKAVKVINSENRFALTGTPIENRLSELWSIFDYLMPGYLYSYKFFKEKFEEAILKGTSKQEKKALEQLHTMITPFILRRLKKDVLQELPDKIEEVIYTKLEGEQKQLYQATEKQIVDSLKGKTAKEFKENKLQILTELMRLRQICCDPSLIYNNYKKESAKLNSCLDLVESAVESGHHILLFSQFTSMLAILEKELKKRKIKTLKLTGSTKKEERVRLVKQFQNEEADVFLISLKAGGTGLNLTAADVVIHYDPWWNTAVQNQATDRAHRIGQEKNVTVMKLITKGTIEERILKLQEMKQELADKIISEESVSLASLTKDEIMSLFTEE